MKGKRVLAGILLAGILAVTLAGCKNTDNTKEEPEKLVKTDQYTIETGCIPAVYGIQRSPFCFRTAVFRNQRPSLF